MSEGFSRKPWGGRQGGACLQAGSPREVGGPVSKPAHPRKLGALSPSQLTLGSWGLCLQASSPQAGLVPLCPLGRWLDGSSCKNPHCPVVGELNKHQVLPFGSTARNWRLGRTSESTRTEEKKRKLFLIP